MGNNPVQNFWPENWGCLPWSQYTSDRHNDGFNAVHWDGSSRYYGYDEFFDTGDFWKMMRVYGAGTEY
jgi:prepilin-type processing-associated H-X9-DG protein